ncbi:DUF805 domain-containing protein [Niallia endozanthoxylica]|uniref:DUF805 domain-containing protein n=1 Tax=Niallia endozanthoxylica TaxID=2036016 RepID=A0A5J5HXT6_9BACI|nr:DUF805 domain-containing protein [Niallia endozanthoxylica]KAA9026944.1 DUF805 domain-containing protein [Niallia endozanthoxylica]
MQWYLKVLKNYVGFQGRATRQEYWMFVLMNFIAVCILSIVELLLGIPGVLTGIYGLAVFLPSLAVLVRRLHDIGKSGWWFLISFIPFIGTIVLIVFACQESQSGENQYGLNPKFNY